MHDLVLNGRYVWCVCGLCLVWHLCGSVVCKWCQWFIGGVGVFVCAVSVVYVL